MDQRKRSEHSLPTIAIIVMLLALHMVLAATSVRQKSNTFDELIHLTGGYSYWKFNDYRFHPENGNLPQRWVALPLLFQDLVFPEIDLNVYEIAHEFFFRLGNDANAMLFQGRLMIVLLSLFLGTGVYLWSSSIFGPTGGLISLGLYSFSPTILAHARLTTSDLAVTLFFIFAVGSVWRVLHRVTVRSIAGACLAVSGLLLSKMSAVLILPVSILIILVKIVLGMDRPMVLGKNRLIRTRLGQAGVAAGAVFLVGMVSVVLIWAAYGFRFSVSSDSAHSQKLFYSDWAHHLESAGRFKEPIAFLRDNKLLPEAYLYGFTYVISCSQVRAAFVAGRYSNTGWWYFFPFCFAVKTPLSTFLVAGFAILALVCLRRGNDWYSMSPLLCFTAVYLGLAMTANLNIGHRHILPIYPVIFIFAGAAVRWYSVFKRPFLIVLPLVVAVFLFETQSIRPHYLAFFNMAAGGPQNGYRLLADSSLDWGQDLPGLAQWIDGQGAAGNDKVPFYLAYFGTASPVYHQVQASIIAIRPLPWLKDVTTMAHKLGPGYYCISATELQQVYGFKAEWSQAYDDAYWARRKLFQKLCNEAQDPEILNRLSAQLGGEERLNQLVLQYRQLEFARLCVVLRQREPETSIGHSILIYLVSPKELDRALNGPKEGLNINGNMLLSQKHGQEYPRPTRNRKKAAA